MRVKPDKILEEYHVRRAIEHFPTQYFINEKYLDIGKIPFSRMYRAWRNGNKKELFIISTEMYLKWLTDHFKKDLTPLENYWHVIKQRTPNNNFLSSSLIVAMTIFSIHYPEIELTDVCGGSNLTLNKYKKSFSELMKDKTPLRKSEIKLTERKEAIA